MADGGAAPGASQGTGIGISSRDQARIFAPFAQAESTAAREFGGTGLGLVICKNLVELMGGEIGCTSTRGAGSTFWFRLPLVPACQPAPVFERPVARRRLRPVAADAPRVLVVDDNAVNRLVAESHLEVLGLRTATAASGPRALALLAERHFDAILMDCRMPKVDGYETTRRLRQQEADRDRRSVVIGVTAHAGKGARESALGAGMDDFLAKPFRVEELGAVLERWLPFVARQRPSGAGTPDAGPESGKNLRARTAEAFRRDGARDLETMRQVLAEGDAVALAHGAHALGGSSDVLDASALAELCGELEDLAWDGDLAGCRARLPAIEIEFDRLADELDRLADELDRGVKE